MRKDIHGVAWLGLAAPALAGLTACGGAGTPTGVSSGTCHPTAIHRSSGDGIGQPFCVTGKYTVDYSGDTVGCQVILHGPDGGSDTAETIFGAPGTMQPGDPLFGLEPGTYHFEQTSDHPELNVPCTAKFTVSLIPVNG